MCEGKKLGIRNYEEFSLQRESTGNWLHPSVSILEQGVTEDEVLILKRKFYSTAPDRSDPVQLHLLYVQVINKVIVYILYNTREMLINFYV